MSPHQCALSLNLRDILKRGEAKTTEQQELARKFGKEFFDGDRGNGYGGYYYNERFWIKVIPDFIKFYNLKDGDKILDIGCGKGFMLYDLKKEIPGIKLNGIDVSNYAIRNSKKEVKKYLKVADARKLPFTDKDPVKISINIAIKLGKLNTGVTISK